MVAPHLWETQGNSLESPLSSQSVSCMICGAKACTEIFGLPWDSGLSPFPLGPHAAFFTLSITPSHSCHQCLVPFPTARQVLCPSYPYMFLFLSRSVVSDHPASLLWRLPVSARCVVYQSRGEAAESVAERFVWPVSMAEIAFWETASVNLLNLIPGYREYIGLGPVAGKSPDLC